MSSSTAQRVEKASQPTRPNETRQKVIDTLARVLMPNPHMLGKFMGYPDLTEVHSDWIRYCYDSPGNASLQAHRNGFKTTTICVVGAVAYLLRRPETRILIVRKDLDGAKSILSEIRRHYESEHMQKLYWALGYREIEAKGDRWRSNSIRLAAKKKPSKEGNIEAISMGGAVTGRHYDIIIADDLITRKDRYSKAEREETKNFVRELQNIPQLGTGRIIYTGTPWHKEDAWTIMPEPRKFPVGSIEIPGLTEEKLLEIRRNIGESLYAANYRLEHVTVEGREFENPRLAPFRRDVPVRAYLDPAYQGNHTTGLTIGGMLGQDRAKSEIILTGWTWRKHVVDLYPQIVSLLQEYNVGTLYVESNADKGMSVRDLRQMFPSVVPVTESQNKHHKITSYLKQNWSRLIWDSGCQPEYMEQVVEYQEGVEPDDGPDSAASLVRVFVKPGFQFKGIGPDGARI